MARPQMYTPEQVIAALQHTKGMVYMAARHLGCSHTTIYTYIKRYASIRKVRDQLHGELLDMAELKMHEAILESEPWAIQFALRTIGKNRGYVERAEVKSEGEIKIVFDNDWKKS